MIKYTLTILSGILLFSINSIAQRGFYTKEGVTKAGVQIVDMGDFLNASTCRVKISDEKVEEFTADEIEEYGISKKKKYVSREITDEEGRRKVFLQELDKGDLSIYYLKKKNEKVFYILDSIGELTVLRKGVNDNYKQELAEETKNCLYSQKNTKLLRYNKRYLAKFAKYHNSCTKKSFPYAKYGIEFGLGSSKIDFISTSEVELNQIIGEYQNTYMLGGFVETPMGMSNFYFKIKLNFIFNRFNYSGVVVTFFSPPLAYDVSYDASSTFITVPLLLKYAIPTRTVRPSVFAGLQLGHNMSIKEEFKAVEVSTQPTNGEETIEDPMILANYTFGFKYGLGLEIPIYRRNTLFLEYSQDINYPLNDKDQTFQVNQFINVGVSF